MSNYNYDGFSTDGFNLGEFHRPKVGSNTPDFELQTADGAKAKLLDSDGDFLG